MSTTLIIVIVARQELAQAREQEQLAQRADPDNRR